MHGVPNLTWNAQIAQNAQNWADEQRGNMAHSSSNDRKNIAGYNLGENLAKGYGVVGPQGVAMWYDEIAYAGYSGKVYSFGYKTGHYTQVVWKGTLLLGCGSYDELLVCQYGPGGNMGGAFRENERPLTGVSASQCGAP